MTAQTPTGGEQVAGSWAASNPGTCDRRERHSMWLHLPTWLSQPGLHVAGVKLWPPRVSKTSEDLESEPEGKGSWAAPTPMGPLCTDRS